MKITDKAFKQIKLLAETLRGFDFFISEEQKVCLYKYVNKILDWNKRVNLIARGDELNVVKRHIYESVSIPVIVPLLHQARIMDIGSGAGFPGLPLKIIRPDFEVMLIESKRMRALFLTEVIEELHLKSIKVFSKRIEDISVMEVEGIDIVVSRAVAELKTLWEWSAPHLNKKGIMLALKGGDIHEEIRALRTTNPSLKIETALLPPELVNTTLKRLLIIVKQGDET